MLKDSPHKFVYNFFKFLEKKKGTETPLRVKFLYAPDEITDEDLNVEGDLDLSYTSITSIPDNLQVGGHLDLENTNIETLPDNLKVGGFLDLDNSLITSLPDNLKVGGTLNIKNTDIKTLPNNLQVGGFLDLINTPIAKKYTKEEVRNMIEDKGGYVKEFIYV
jgi:hypothetical protein